MAAITGWEKARENYKEALAAPKSDDLDFVDEGAGRFDPPVVSLLRCQSCGLFSTTRYCLACRTSMER